MENECNANVDWEETWSFNEIASRLGYNSEAAFSLAFKRIVDVSPGIARRTGEKLAGNRP